MDYGRGPVMESPVGTSELKKRRKNHGIHIVEEEKKRRKRETGSLVEDTAERPIPVAAAAGISDLKRTKKKKKKKKSGGMQVGEDKKKKRKKEMETALQGRPDQPTAVTRSKPKKAKNSHGMEIAKGERKRSKKRKNKTGTEGEDEDGAEVPQPATANPSNESKRKRKKMKFDLQDKEEHPPGAQTLTVGKRENGVDLLKSGHQNEIAVKYVAPHLRQAANDSADRIQLVRRTRGLLNRLTADNLENITSNISTIFQVNGRRLMTEIISKEIVGACCEGPRGNEQYAAVFAAFVAGLSATEGMDFGAKFVAALALALEEQYNKGDSLATRNLALLLSHLYIFHLLPSELVYELLGVLCKRFKELDVATILNVLQTCGMGLRGDDPLAMKDFVLSVQQRTAEAKAERFSKGQGGTTSGEPNKRVEFMLQTICDIKNNKRSNKESPAHLQMKKWLNKLRVDDVQLRAVTWKILLDPDKKGQWWLPSAAANTEHGMDVRGEMAGAMDAGMVEADKMLQLAAMQRMNTDARRAVFCMVMSGEDYIDAFEKILRMKLPGTQDREVLRVIVECCLQEKLFNKYYVLLAAKLCDHDKNHKFTLQYCLWDHFKQLDAMELRRAVNLARFLAHLFGLYSLSLSVLKAVDFSDSKVMTSKAQMHFRVLFDTLLTEYSEDIIWNCFSRIAAPSNLAPLRDGLAVFLRQQQQMMRVREGSNEGKKNSEVLARRYLLAKKGLSNVAGEPLQQ